MNCLAPPGPGDPSEELRLLSLHGFSATVKGEEVGAGTETET